MNKGKRWEGRKGRIEWQGDQRGLEEMRKVTEATKPPGSLKALTNVFRTVLHCLGEQAAEPNLQIIAFELCGASSRRAHQTAERTASK